MSVKQRLYPCPSQAAWLVKHCHDARFVFNIGLEQRGMWKRSKHDRGTHPELGTLDVARVNTASQMRELAQLRGELDWLREGSSAVQQAALRDLDRALVNFYAGRARFPTFKRRSDRSGSFYIRDLSVRRVNRRWGEVLVPKVGYLRFRITRGWVDIENASSARVTQRNGIWHVSFTTPPPPKITARTGALVGIDRGVANTIALSDGEMSSIPTLTVGEQRRFLALQRRLARQTRTAKAQKRKLSECRNREKTLDQLGRLRVKLDSRRTDWVEQTTTSLARTYDAVVIENLAINNMVRAPKPKPDETNPGQFLTNGARAKASLNRAIHASRWGQFATRLEHKTIVVKVPAAYTSQRCHSCDHTAPENRESQAVFKCVNCGQEGHADTNAARNILAAGEPEAIQLLQPEDHRGHVGSTAVITPAPEQPANPRGNRTTRQDAA